MTVIGTSYRLPAKTCIRSAVSGISECHLEHIELSWSILDEEQLNLEVIVSFVKWRPGGPFYK